MSKLPNVTLLEKIRAHYGGNAAEKKLALLAVLGREMQVRTDMVNRLHEVLCYLRAYPDDERVLAAVEGILEGFGDRADLQRHAESLKNSGIAGTAIEMRFFAQMALWLTERHGQHLHVVWNQIEEWSRVIHILPLLVPFSENAAMEDLAFSPADWCEILRGHDETDAGFLVRRIAALGLEPFMHEYVYQELGLTLRLDPAPDTPSRTRAKRADARVHWQTTPIDRGRPELPADALCEPLAVRAVSAREGAEWIDMAREAMVTRERDLDVFAYGDPHDVRVVEWGEGLQFVAIGALPARRLLFEAVYGFLTIKNGVPIGYVLNSALHGSAEIAYNVFETYRGGEAGRIYGRVLSTVRHLFGVDSFTIYPYQLGHENDEALLSGAWWFYQKLGFRAKDPEVLALMERELARMKRDPEHRTSIDTLADLAKENVYWHMGRARTDVIGLLHSSDAGLVVGETMAERFGSDRERAQATCEREAAALLGGAPEMDWSDGERLAWTRWAPLVTCLPGVKGWTRDERLALREVVRAKGGRRESDFVLRFDAHPKLRKAVRAMVRAAGQS